MRSARGFEAALILLLGVAVGVFVEIAVGGGGGEDVLHFALGVSFLLLALAVFDFELPAWISLAASIVTRVLAAIFLLQGASDLLRSDPLRRLAYEVLGQGLEKVLGYAFLLWCIGLLAMDSSGKTRILGATVLATILCVEIYSFGVSFSGGEAPSVLKLSYLALFVWLLLESMKVDTQLAETSPAGYRSG